MKGSIIAQYLNTADPKGRKLMLALVAPIQRLTQLLPDIMQGSPYWISREGRRAVWYSLTANAEARVLLRKINRGLARHVFRRQLPKMFYVYDDEPPALWTTQSRLELKAPGKKKKDVEAYVVTLVLEVAEAGALDRVRQCPNCHRWFMAHRSDQEFCKGECSRESYYKTHKEKWPGYQKVYRENKKEREQYQDKRRSNVKN